MTPQVMTPTVTEQASVGISAYKVRENVSDIDNNSPDFNAERDN